MTQGPREDGWWQASDGLWYPPETHPAYTPPTGPIDLGRTPPEGIPLGPGAPTARLPGPPPAPPPPLGREGARSPGARSPGARPATRTAPGPRRPPVPPPERGPSFGGGCLVALLVTVALAIALVLGARYLIDRARQEVSQVPDAVGRAVGGAVGGKCDFLTDEQASEALGGGAKVVGLGSIASGVRPALDARLLPDAPTCWVAAAKGRVARVARVDAADANAQFDAAAAAARRGPRPYHAGTVRGFRSEAFCTTLNTAGSSGVLARRGTRLVYASVTPDLTRYPGGLDRVADRIAADNCRTARALAASALG
jgi:hypothetical protein